MGCAPEPCSHAISWMPREGLAILARGGKLELNDEGRERAALLASIVQAADHRAAKPGPGAASEP